MKNFLFLRNPSDHRIVKVNYCDIVLIEAAGDYIKIVTLTRNFMLHFKIGEILRFLDREMFLRCHRSYIVNIALVTQIEYERADRPGRCYINPKIIIMDNKIPLADYYKKSFLSSINYVSHFYETKLDSEE